MSEATAVIRQAVHDGPSRDGFTKIARAFDRLRPEETAGMLAFASKHLEAWPHEVRVAPMDWWRRISRGEEVPGFSFVRALELDSPGGGPEVARAIAGSASSRQYLFLAIRGEPIGDQGAAELARAERLVQLRRLSLVDTAIGPAGIRDLLQGRLRPLESLELAGNTVTPEAAEALLRAVDEGGALSLARCCAGAESARRIASSERIERLSSLDLSGDDIGDAGAGALSASGWLGHLSEIALASNGITSRGARALSRAGWIGELGALDLSDNPIGDEGFRMLWPRLVGLSELRIARAGIDAADLTELLARARLAELDASGNRLSREALERMAPIRRLSLRDAALDPSAVGLLAGVERDSLDLAGNSIGPSAAAVLAQTSLAHLDLSRTDLGDTGLALIAAGRAMKALRSLSLQNDGITPDGLDALLTSRRTVHLTRIDLSGNPLGSEGASRLAKSALIARLTRIRARNCGFTPDWIETLRAAALHAVVEA